jgi:hypothetical protein
MNMQVPTPLSLEDLVKWYTDMLDVVQKLDPSIKERLKTILEKSKYHADALLRSPELLKQQIDEYLLSIKPFEWNRDKKQNPANAERDWKQHDNLIILAMLLGDKSILKEWGVDYPLKADGPGLADPSQNYIQNLEEVSKGCTEGQKVYYDYLIAELQNHSGIGK